MIFFPITSAFHRPQFFPPPGNVAQVYEILFGSSAPTLLFYVPPSLGLRGPSRAAAWIRCLRIWHFALWCIGTHSFAVLPKGKSLCRLSLLCRSSLPCSFCCVLSFFHALPGTGLPVRTPQSFTIPVVSPFSQTFPCTPPIFKLLWLGATFVLPPRS